MIYSTNVQTNLYRYGNASEAKHCKTEQPYISISSEMVRGFRELGAAFTSIGATQNRSDYMLEGKQLSREADALQADFIVSLRRSTLAPNASWGGTVCHPHIAGWPSCKWDVGLPPITSSSSDLRSQMGTQIRPNQKTFAMEARTYSEALYSGVIPADIVKDIVVFVSRYIGVLGHISPNGPGTANGGETGIAAGFCTFIDAGWGYGLLQTDLIDRFLLYYFAISAHAMSRGTFTAPECTQLDRSIAHTDSYCAPSQAVLPILTKWLLVFDDYATETLWLGKAVPRVWLSPGERVSIQRAPTRYGRISVVMDAKPSYIDVNVTLPASFTWPSNGIQIRTRLPRGMQIASVTVGGRDWKHFDAANETVIIAPRSASVAQLQSIQVRTSDRRDEYRGAEGSRHDEREETEKLEDKNDDATVLGARD